MDSFHIASDAAFRSCGDDQTTVWSECLGSEQPAPVFDFDLGLDSQFTDIWNSTPPFGNPASGIATVANPEVTTTMGFSPTFMYPQHSSFNQIMFPDMSLPWPTPMPTPSSTDGDSAPTPSQSVASWADNIHPASEVVAGLYSVPVPSSSTAPAIPSEPELPWFEVPGQFNETMTSFLGGGDEIGPYAPYTDFLGVMNTVGYYGQSTALRGPSLDATNSDGDQSTSRATYTLAPPRPNLRKRPRGADEAIGGQAVEADNGQERRRRKKAKGKTAVNGVSEAARHTKKARRKPVTRTPVQESNAKFEVAGRGAERLAAQNTQELYHRFLLGPSTQESTEATAWENQPWVEGREQEATWQHENSAVEPQEASSSATVVEQAEDAEAALFRIPKRLNERHSGLLNATAEDWARALVRALKCKLCPDAGFCNWEGFKRHCDQSEAHPFKLFFCGWCGDFFARIDALKRHRESPPPECLCVTPEEALAKRRATERAHREFQEKLERFLKTGEDIGDLFAQIIMDMFPNSSKRGSRQQNRLDS